MYYVTSAKKLKKPKQWKEKQPSLAITVTFINWKALSVRCALSLL